MVAHRGLHSPVSCCAHTSHNGGSPMRTSRRSATLASGPTSTTRRMRATSVGRSTSRSREALHFVRRNMLVRAAKSTARVEQPQFSERAVFEALVNAVAHRDYSMAGARVRLHMFGDRLELHVPGALANTIELDSMHLRQSSRNELIVSLLARCPAPTGLGRPNLMDVRGDGLPIIRQQTRSLSGRYPEYAIIGDSELRLVIPAATSAPRA